MKIVFAGSPRFAVPTLERLAAQYAGRVKIAKLNVDQNPMTAQQYRDLVAKEKA